ncbi:MAG: MerR family transcriptional regulator [Actinomycetota bacterium]
MEPSSPPIASGDLLAMDDLIAAANEAVADLPVEDGRVASALTERNVRYYVTLGLVRPAVRVGGRSLWTRDHVNDLIRIRRAQATGQSLKLIPRFRESRGPDAWRLANVALESRHLVSAALRSSHALTEPTVLSDASGWSVRISDSITLSGFTTRQPTDKELRAVRAALAQLDDN